MTIAQQHVTTGSHLVFDIVQALRENKARDAAGACTNSIRIKVLRNYSAEFMEPFIKYYFGQIGIASEVSFGGYDTIHQELLGSEDLRAYDLVILSLTQEALDPDRQIPSGDMLDHVTGLLDLVLQKSSAPVVFNTFIRPIFNEGGAAFASQESSETSRVCELNHGLRAYAAKQPRCFLIDWERLVMLVGVEAAVDRRMGYIAAAPFRNAFLSAYSYEIFRIGRALKGAGKKCLVLDCDNTLWGGIVGEAGLEGIDLDRTKYPGKAFYDFQRSIVRLVERGIMVALCSKNNLDDVMEVLDHHPHCLLKREHLVSYRINWDDKERNLEALIEELNIGQDSVVFIDDSPIECERIKAFLPDVTVRAVPKQLHDLPILLDRESFFDRLKVTEEDLRRVKLYQTETKRREVAATFASVEEFLTSLNLTARIEIPIASRIARVSQLTQRTNQFNLTTRRYAESDIASMLDSPDHAVFTLSAGDRFGDMGLTGVFIARRTDAEEAAVDSLLMSCRVLGRQLEQEFVARCIEALDGRWGPRRWTAEYIKTRKNGQVEAFWPTFGFTVKDKSDLRTSYCAERTALTLKHVPYIQVQTA
jgi:FkbH-like protein